MTNASPSQNPANSGSMAGLFREVLGKFVQGMDDMLPARVISYDRASNRAQVQPMVMMVTTDDQRIERAPVASVPVFQIGGGGFLLSFNLKAGDLGWIKANDRDISLFLQSGALSSPNTLRKHSFQDAVFFPDPMRGYEIAAEDAENCVLQNMDGSVRVSIWPDKVKITAPTVEISAPEVSIISDTLSHNGVDIGATHRHGGVQSGPSTTGVPV